MFFYPQAVSTFPSHLSSFMIVTLPRLSSLALPLYSSLLIFKVPRSRLRRLSHDPFRGWHILHPFCSFSSSQKPNRTPFLLFRHPQWRSSQLGRAIYVCRVYLRSISIYICCVFRLFYYVFINFILDCDSFFYIVHSVFMFSRNFVCFRSSSFPSFISHYFLYFILVY